MSITKYFVTNNNIPDFIRTENSLFESFIEAYYEWLEIESNDPTSKYSDVYKAVGNPASIINRQEIIVDIDESLDVFMKYFSEEVCPISIEGMKTNPNFFLKNIRELYLAKGTEKSFKLFFKLYYDHDISVFETRDTVIKASDGKYFSFPTAHVLVKDKIENSTLIDYVLANLYDSSRNYVATLISGLVVDDVNGTPIIKISLSTDIQLDPNETYYIVDLNNEELEIEVGPLYTITNISIIDGGALFATNDKLLAESAALSKRFFGSISSVGQGYIEGLKIRNPGVYYSTSDSFEILRNGGAVGTFQPTVVDSVGRIEAIDDILLRTGPDNTGYKASTLVDVSVPMHKNALMSDLPTIRYIPGSSRSQETFPYTGGSTGFGFQVIPYSRSIGSAKNILLSQTPYFLNDSDIFINAPHSIIVQNNTLKVGDTVSYQLFNQNTSLDPYGLDDDSDYMSYTIHLHRVWDHVDSDGTTFDSEVRMVVTHELPIGWDSDKAWWNIQEVTFDSKADSDEMFKPLLDLMDSESNFSFKYVIDNGPTGIDGGDTFGFSGPVANEVDGFYDFSLDDSETWICGGPYFAFSYSFKHQIKFTFHDQFTDWLDNFHFGQLQETMDKYDSFNKVNYDYARIGVNLIESIPADIGKWEDTGYYAEVVSLNPEGTVAKLVTAIGSPVIDQNIFDNLTDDKYSLMLATPLNKDGVHTSEHGTPLENVVLQFAKLEIDYEVGTVSTLTKQFWTEDGFLSSSYGGTLQDNYYFSDYSYRIKSTLPFSEWKDKFKKMLHPAGLVLSAELVSNSNTISPNVFTASTSISDNYGSYLTFDQQQEIVYDVENGVNADTALYNANAFEYLNTITNTAVAMDASVQTNQLNPKQKMQSGNAWWDYEPAGWVYEAPMISAPSGYENLTDEEFINKFSTQDSDGEGHVNNDYHYYNKFKNNSQDFYKTNSRYVWPGGKTIEVVKTQFEDNFITEYSTYDNALPTNFVQTFSDSEGVSFRTPLYEKVRTDSDQRFPTFEVPRQAELMVRKERDLFIAMKEEKLLIWVEGSKTYYDFAAYERKWNQINTRRTINNEGYIEKLLPKLETDYYSNSINKNRNKYGFNLFNVADRYYTVNKPYNKDTWETGDVMFTKFNYPNGQINSVYALPVEEPITYKDPQVSMKGRKK